MYVSGTWICQHHEKTHTHKCIWYMNIEMIWRYQFYENHHVSLFSVVGIICVSWVHETPLEHHCRASSHQILGQRLEQDHTLCSSLNFLDTMHDQISDTFISYHPKKNKIQKKTSSNAQKRSKKGVFKDKSPFSIYLEFHKSHHYEFPRLRGFPKDAIVSHRAKARLLLNLLWSSDMDLLNMIF